MTTVKVNQGEANLLTVARIAVGVVPPIDAMRLLVTSVAPPPKLGPGARAVLSETLSRGLVLLLAREGGWQAEGGLRLWERFPAPPLAFTGNVVRFLSWVLMTPLAEADASPLVFEGPLTPAEDVLVATLLDRLRGTGCEWLLARQFSIRALPLTTLTHPALMARETALGQLPKFEPQVLAPFVEGLKTFLARAWVSAERAKSECDDPQVLIRVGRAQTQVLETWFSSIDAAGRHELASFVVDAAVSTLSAGVSAQQLTRSLSADGLLRERTEARRAAAALLRGLATLREWDQQHRTVRFIDDGYAQAQRLVADWGRLGEIGFSKAAQLVAELDSLSLAPRSGERAG